MPFQSMNQASGEGAATLATGAEMRAGERTPLFVTAQADARQSRIARKALLVFFLIFLAAAPFARTELPRIDAFLPLYASARVVIETLTAFLLFALFRSIGNRSVLLLGSGYLFSVLMAVAHTASFPGVFTPRGAFGETSQATAWLYFLWHGGFSVVLLAYGLRSPEAAEAVVHRSAKEIVLATTMVFAAAGAAIAAVWLAGDLPDLMQGHRDAPAKIAIAALTWILNACALGAIYRRRPRSVLDLWVIMVAAACLFDTALAALLNHGRFDLGWYAGRIYGLLAAGFVLAMLLVEYTRLHRELVQHHISMRRTSVQRLQIALTSLSVAQRAASAGFWDWDIANGKFNWSSELFQLFGLDPRRTSAGFEAWRRIVHPEDVALAEARVDEALKSMKPLLNRYRIVRGDGTVRWIDVHGDVVRNERGDAVRLTGLCIDVTDRVAADEALRESEGKLRLFVEHAPSALSMFDHAMCYIAVSRRWMSDYGLDESIIGRCHYDVFPEVPERWKEIHRRALAGAVIRSEEDRFDRLDGSVHWLRWEVRPWFRANGSIGGMVVMSEDISERKRVQDALRDSEYFYRQTLESMPGMVFTTRPDGYCDYQSQQWEEYTGVPVAELRGDDWNTLLHPDDRRMALDAWYAALGERGTYDLEYRVRRRDGVHEWFKVIGRPIRDANGKVVRWLGVAVNIERLKQAEALLAQRSRELEAALEVIPAIVYVKDAERKFTRVNTAMCELFGLAAEQMLGRTSEEFMPAALAQASRGSDLVVLDSRASIKNVEQYWRDEQGREHWMSTSKSPFRNDDGSIAGLVGVSVDITEQKQAEARRVLALERQRDALVREVHHRIKNHLQGVIGLLRYKSATRTEASSRIELAIEQIASIAQVYGLQGRNQDAQLRLHEIVESAIQGASFPVGFECSPQLRDVVVPQADAVPLALVINELMTNAIKHLAVGEHGRTRVRVRLDRAAAQVRIEIRSGPAHLPPGFDYARRCGLGTGLDLVTVLLPEQRYALRIAQDADEVVAELHFLCNTRGTKDGAADAAQDARG